MTTADPLTPVAARPADRFVPYLEASGYPLTGLLFVVPLMVAYELGTQWYASDPVSHVQQRIVAFNLMRNFFEKFHITGMYFPPATVASILFAWHLARADPFAARPGVLVGMAVESAMYAIPLVGLGYAFQHYLPLHLPCASPYGAMGGNARALVVLSIGAGVYEELIFRLVAFTVLHAVLVDVCRVPKAIAVPAMVVLAAVAFSLYHYHPSGTEPFQWESFAFRTVAGIYFGLIFATRGFGLTAGAHAGYDVLIVLLKATATV